MILLEKSRGQIRNPRNLVTKLIRNKNRAINDINNQKNCTTINIFSNFHPTNSAKKSEPTQIEIDIKTFLRRRWFSNCGQNK